jgi:hypothetical protein
VRPALKADVTAICVSIVKEMWGPRRLTFLWASTACYRDSFTFIFWDCENEWDWAVLANQPWDIEDCRLSGRSVPRAWNTNLSKFVFIIADKSEVKTRKLQKYIICIIFFEKKAIIWDESNVSCWQGIYLQRNYTIIKLSARSKRTPTFKTFKILSEVGPGGKSKKMDWGEDFLG